MKIFKPGKEYKHALQRIFILMNNTQKNSPYADELELLILLVEKYEEGLVKF